MLALYLISISENSNFSPYDSYVTWTMLHGPCSSLAKLELKNLARIEKFILPVWHHVQHQKVIAKAFSFVEIISFKNFDLKF